MQRIVLLTLVLLHGSMLPLMAQSTDKGTLGPLGNLRAQREAQRTAGRWRDDLQKVGELLEEEKWKRARRQAEGLCDEMSQQVIAGFDAHLGSCVGLRAVARMAMGDEDDARWDWELARQLWETLGPDFLSGFGDVGERLNAEDDPYATAESDRGATPSPGSEAAGGLLCTLPRCDGELVQPPVATKQVKPKYPYGASVGGHEDIVVVMVIIGEDGIPRHPRIMKASPTVMLTYRALEALREWRFEPARLQGEAVSVLYTLTVDFRIER